MATDRNDFQPPPWWMNGPDDYTKHRTGAITYTMDDLIGRRDLQKKYKLVTSDPATTLAAPDSVLE